MRAVDGLQAASEQGAGQVAAGWRRLLLVQGDDHPDDDHINASRLQHGTRQRRKSARARAHTPHRLPLMAAMPKPTAGGAKATVLLGAQWGDEGKGVCRSRRGGKRSEKAGQQQAVGLVVLWWPSLSLCGGTLTPFAIAIRRWPSSSQGSSPMC